MLELGRNHQIPSSPTAHAFSLSSTTPKSYISTRTLLTSTSSKPSNLLCLLFLCVLPLPLFQIPYRKMAQNVAESPLERNTVVSLDQKLALAKRYSHAGVIAGAKAAVVASIATAIPTLASVRMLPGARAHLNHTAQALIISTVAGAAYFIVADKTVLATARRNSLKKLSKDEV